jgi:hypothetical protein
MINYGNHNFGNDYKLWKSQIWIVGNALPANEEIRRRLISPTCLCAAFTHTDHQSAKRHSKSLASFLRFWDLLAKKMLVRRW